MGYKIKISSSCLIWILFINACSVKFASAELLRIFVTKNIYNGDFKKYGTNAFEGADRLCNNDPRAYHSNSGESAVFKALIVGNGRTVTQDWPLFPSIDYYVQEDKKNIITTNSFGTFDFDLTHSIALGGEGAELSWTGLKRDWSSDANNCNNWNGPNKSGTVGNALQVNADSISYSVVNCGKEYHLYCVQQPRLSTKPLHIFVATNPTEKQYNAGKKGNGWHGDLMTTANNLGANVTSGIAAADYYCNHSLERPSKDGTTMYKALIGSYTYRYGCDDSGCGGEHAKDWPLQANTTYINLVGQVIGTTSDNRIFRDDLRKSIAENGHGGKVWTGLNERYQGYFASCENWTSNAHSSSGHYPFGTIGKPLFLNEKFINADIDRCNNKNNLYCVEMPN